MKRWVWSLFILGLGVATPMNAPPVADAGPDQTVDEQSIVTLEGLGSTDPDGSIRQYAWAQLSGPPVTLLPTFTRPTPQFVAPAVTTDTVLTFQLTVWDNSFLSSSDTVSITVRDVSLLGPTEPR
ncbi:PKD domain-containing protein [Hyalangium gracile]|uniref:PKD domain-containing protein n=1 Tax=Hyalangium gracile TaxID=394092 RepID=UPI001CCAC38E|nr:PKD domain-containing protein [Hyalangium gracile]